MKEWSFYAVVTVSAVVLLMVGLDAVAAARARWRRRRLAQGGVYGVVLDVHGKVIGTYVDPLQEPGRATRVHGPGSVWTGSDPADPTAWAWEGRAETEEEALRLASRLRGRHVRLLPGLRDGTRRFGEEESTPPCT